MIDEHWSLNELFAGLERFEAAARQARLSEASVRTYVDRSRFFVRWLGGEFDFRGPNTSAKAK